MTDLKHGKNETDVKSVCEIKLPLENHIVFDNTLTMKSLVVLLSMMDFVVKSDKDVKILKGLKGIKIKKY